MLEIIYAIGAVVWLILSVRFFFFVNRKPGEEKENHYDDRHCGFLLARVDNDRVAPVGHQNGVD